MTYGSESDLELLFRCDAILMTPDWERSSGARAERDFAIRNAIPVLYDVSEVADL